MKTLKELIVEYREFGLSEDKAVECALADFNAQHASPEVANAKATDKPKAKPVDPLKEVIFSVDFEPVEDGKVIKPSKYMGKGLKGKALRRVNTLALQKKYKTVKGCLKGWEFEDDKERTHALENFNFIHNLTVEMFLEYLKGEYARCMNEAEYFDKALAEARKEYGVK